MDRPWLEDRNTDATALAHVVEEQARQPGLGTPAIIQTIEAMPCVAMGAVMPIDEIGTIIDKLIDISNNIGSDLEELTWAAYEIGRHAVATTMVPQELGLMATRLQESALTSTF